MTPLRQKATEGHSKSTADRRRCTLINILRLSVMLVVVGMFSLVCASEGVEKSNPDVASASSISTMQNSTGAVFTNSSDIALDSSGMQRTTITTLNEKSWDIYFKIEEGDAHTLRGMFGAKIACEFKWLTVKDNPESTSYYLRICFDPVTNEIKTFSNAAGNATGSYDVLFAYININDTGAEIKNILDQLNPAAKKS